MTCIIVEDQPPAQRILIKYIENIGSLKLKGVFSDATQAIEFLKTEAIDLIFLDIHLPKISGIDFLKTILNPPSIILTTAFSKYALESYELNVVDYLLKPFSFQRFVKALSKVPVQRAISQQSVNISDGESYRNELFIKSGYEHFKVMVGNILYIKSDTDYTELCTEEKKYLSSEPLRYWEEKLNSNQFVRVHKSYIINMSKIEKFIGNQIYLSDKVIIPIGRAYKETFVKRIVV